ncbi:hypothetical protein VK72_02300 [Paenibacillus polymyxa]|uniref:hypothetical protein n=1 Tax=Paenibacillus polymyxa TaxID=1406 RepID=UPI000947659F|nr:hypothetical protein [Paenibacillus polymyxa]APQ57676.1 hypothetical protein VK72_02300 [Paenibacillus polymyxa]
MKRILLTIIMTTVVLAGCGTERETQSQNNTDVKAASEAGSNTYVFDMALEDFTEAFNAVAKKYKLDYLHISELKEDSNMFQYRFNDNLSMTGTVDSTHKIHEVMLIGSGGFQEKTGENLMIAIVALIMTTNSDYKFEDAEDVVRDIGLLDNNADLQDFEGATVRNRVKYRIKIKNNDMTTFGIIGAK